jgi:hypothetical protein
MRDAEREPGEDYTMDEEAKARAMGACLRGFCVGVWVWVWVCVVGGEGGGGCWFGRWGWFMVCACMGEWEEKGNVNAAGYGGC